ncbi:DUF7662 domain-containing protein [Guptibacillus algicola]|uniref:DUF7662 domain-containing protein n=1 Tax=Guptibacillus algicola TaxID=225844 RepID=UPI001CD46101|nr:hypothetical protein [Alkalihalobacillus algicola]MCA0987229.1 hypothetical protein [Alkalihalobacillus algicola]
MTVSSEKGKYGALQDYLRSKITEQEEIWLTFGEIESILGFPLPRSASTYNAWWANEMKSHSHARAWLEVGFKVEGLKLGESVKFKYIGKSETPNQICLKTAYDTYTFAYTSLHFNNINEKDIFARKNNRTVEQTIDHHRYHNLKDEVKNLYPSKLSLPLGEFLLELKESDDLFYQNFLNRYGDLEYSSFSIESKEEKNLKGLYTYISQGEVKYIGRCLDDFGKRINKGYGVIHPKNCFKDGQATNCHLNALITKEQKSNEISLYLLPMENEADIKETEMALISAYNPEWNIVGKKG